MQRLPVHCCCDPSIVYGTLEVPDEHCRVGASFTMTLQCTMGELTKRAIPGDPSRTRWEEGSEYVNIEVAALYLPGQYVKHADFILAVKSNELPIETFRRLKGFVENTHRFNPHNFPRK